MLLDTHVALWTVLDDKRLSRRSRDLISDLNNAVFVSVISLWEIAIKFARRRGSLNDMPVSAAEALDHFNRAGYHILAVSDGHALAVGDLPALHRDPFDRMLIAQARFEPLRLLTADRAVAAYGEGIDLAVS